MTSTQEIAREFIFDFFEELIKISDNQQEVDYIKTNNPSNDRQIAEIFSIESFGSEFIASMTYWVSSPNIHMSTSFSIENPEGEMEYRETDSFVDLLNIFNALKKEQS